MSSESALITTISGMPSGTAQATVVSSFLVRPEKEEEGNNTHNRHHQIEIGRYQWAKSSGCPSPMRLRQMDLGCLQKVRTSNHTKAAVRVKRGRWYEAKVGMGSPMSMMDGKPDTGQTLTKSKDKRKKVANLIQHQLLPRVVQSQLQAGRHERRCTRFSTIV
jgi:hypothetical protein